MTAIVRNLRKFSLLIKTKNYQKDTEHFLGLYKKIQDQIEYWNKFLSEEDLYLSFNIKKIGIFVNTLIEGKKNYEK